MNLYTEDYYERGVETGLSLYQNYRWMPELTIPMAMSTIDYLSLTRESKILDFGAAKGFMVKALRLLHRQAWGCDLSSYAVNSADNYTRKYLAVATPENEIPFDFTFDYTLSKDVFEHIPLDEIKALLVTIAKKSKHLFAVIPLGNDGKFIIPAYHHDKTHILIKNNDWWIKTFANTGWELIEDKDYVPGIKENWSNFKGGNGFYLLKSKFI